jgi:hypothetical protein
MSLASQFVGDKGLDMIFEFTFPVAFDAAKRWVIFTDTAPTD